MRASAFAGLATLAAALVLALGLAQQQARDVPRPDAGPAVVPLTRDAPRIEPPPPRVRGTALVSGTVIGQDGQGLTGVAVTLSGNAGSALTGAGGAFAIATAPGVYELRVAGPSVVGAGLRDVRAPMVGLRVVVARKVTIAGVVTDGGAPVPGARVEVGATQLAAPREVSAGPDGRFAIVELPEGSYAVAARAGTRAAIMSGVRRAWPGPWEPLALALGPAAVVVGRVVDEEGAAVAGARVVLSPEEAEGAARRTRADRDGGFLLEGVTPGDHTLEVVAEGYLASAPQLVEASGDGILVVKVTLGRGAVVLGRVTDVFGVGVAGAEIELSGESGGKRTLVSAGDRARRAVWAAGTGGAPPSARFLPVGELGVVLGPIPPIPPPGARPATPASGPALDVPGAQELVTDAGGNFRVTAVPFGRFTVRARHPDFADGEGGPVDTGAAAPATALVVLRRGAAVWGRVVDDQEQPIFGAEIAVRVDDRRVAIGFSGSDGSYLLAHVTGAVELVAAAKGHGSVAREVTIDQALDGARLEENFVLPAAGLSLSGVVRDDEGHPVEGATVQAAAAGAAARSDAGGRFTLTGLPPGAVKLSAQHERFPAATATAEAGADDVELVLVRGGVLEADVRDGNTFGPVLSFRIRGRGPGGATVDRSGTTGEITMGPLAAGRWTLRLEGKGYALREQAVELRPGETTRARLELFQGATVAGTVFSQHGDPVAGARVRSGLVEGTTDRLGAFRLTGVPHGETEIVASHPAEGEGAIVVPLRSGDEALTLQIRLAPP